MASQRAHSSIRRRLSTEARSAKAELTPLASSYGRQARVGVGMATMVVVVSAAASPGSWNPRISAWQELCSVPRVLKRFVYVLKNGETPPRYYTGITSDAARRLAEHNGGSCVHTGKYRPWSIDVVIEFPDERRAVAFERYLKSGSGVAFAQRHLR